MATYTLTTNLIENLRSTDIDILLKMLHFFEDTFEHKLAMDQSKCIYNLYAQATVDQQLKKLYSEWLQLFSIKEKRCEFITVNITTKDKNEAFLEVASKINGYKNIIVYSRNGSPYQCNDNNNINYNGTTIKVLDKDEAVSEIDNKVTNNVTIYQTNESP